MIERLAKVSPGALLHGLLAGAAAARLGSHTGLLGGSPFRPEVNARAVVAKDELFPFADHVFMLGSQHNVTATAAAVLDGNHDSILFIAEKPLVDAEKLCIDI